ncbi:MAG TPA: SAM-dependent methyltransferase [Streptosporangiaceae bacterium]|nr:SAM-dependent methyltransferase [Streptosporangiaceae bacterium]
MSPGCHRLSPTTGRERETGRGERVATPQTLRTREQVARFFTGLDLVEPGLVQVHQWRPDPDDEAPADAISAYGAVGRKLRDRAFGDSKDAPITGSGN